jgi:hypothetical protein
MSQMKELIGGFSELSWWGITLITLIALGQLAFAYYIMPRMMLVVLGLSILISSGWLIWKAVRLVLLAIVGLRPTKSQVSEP